MKYEPTVEKVTIKWFYVTPDGQKFRNIKGLISWAWDATCSCGWESSTGGAIKASVQRSVNDHKFYDHEYALGSSKRTKKDVYQFIQNILDGKVGA